MSLVERALKKIQESKLQEARAASSTQVVGRAPGRVDDTVDIPLREAAPIPLQEPIAVKPVAPVLKQAVEHRRPERTLHIDRTALRAAEILPSPEQERQLADEYRHIKRPLIASAIGRGGPQLQNGHLIMMASALPGDGKTFTSINLALSLALEKDISVLLVDADVAKPHVSKIFQIESEPGLLDVLRDENLDVESVILETDMPGLSILSAGKRSDTASELLASERMEQLVATLGARDPNRIVLFDSPPLLLTSESRALSTVVGQIVVVVRAGVTPQRAVLDAIDLLGEGKSVSLVLNQSDENNHADYYSYYGQRDGYSD